MFFAFCGLWAAAMIAMWISVTRLCYAIEARSGRPILGNGLPGFANVFPVAFNFGVAKDKETQRMRWRMIQRLLVIGVGFAFFLIVLREADI
ncbi:hypothetical protein [Mesorhizobium sp. J428]|uniref:hypothetical protein n=1 Tax=Mesorhizobium sp. J428 TaxID=2898440 RepID=UPI0021519F77|nr:hypothetical protein [Mesorhizobium sp. J428]MCR5858560.1 hypothetical protein [Mesorhizobium sp. J428]